MPKIKKLHKPNFLETMALSGTAALVSKTAAAPIERIKLLMQSQGEMIKSGRLATPYKNIFDCAGRVYKSEGIAPFWRGNLANCLRYFPTQALNFAFKNKIKAMFPSSKDDSQLLKLGKYCASGGLAGIMSTVFVYSLDYCRTRLSADMKSVSAGGGSRQFNGILDVYKKTLATDGIKGLYRGFTISCVGIFVYRGAYFGMYDFLKPRILGEDAGFMQSFLLGYGVTVAAGIASYPIDTVRRRMMMTSGEAVKYSSSLNCAASILKNDGMGAFFRGCGANILRGVAGAGVLAGMDKLKQYYVSMRSEYEDEEEE